MPTLAPKKLRTIPLLGFCLAMLSCAHVPLHSGYAGPQPLPDALKQEYAQPVFSQKTDELLLTQEGAPSVRTIRLAPVRNLLPEPMDILIEYYHPGGTAPVPVILVLPNLGGSIELSDSFATYFVRHGYAALLVHREKRAEIIEDLDAIEENLRQIIIDHRQVLDWVETRPELDPTRIGAFGISTGSFKAALLKAVDKRIRAGVLALTGGDLPYLLTHTNENRATRTRERYMKSRGLSLAQLEEKLRREVHTDPMLLAPYLDARDLLLVLGAFDRTVPFAKGRKFRRKIGRPETIYLLSGHYSAILYKNYIKYKATEFFNRKLGAEAPPLRQAAAPSPR